MEKNVESTLVLAGEKVFLEITERYFEFESNSAFVVGVFNQLSNFLQFKVEILSFLKCYKDNFKDGSEGREYLGYLQSVFLEEKDIEEKDIAYDLWLLINDHFKGFFDFRKYEEDDDYLDEDELES